MGNLDSNVNNGCEVLSSKFKSWGFTSPLKSLGHIETGRQPVIRCQTC